MNWSYQDTVQIKDGDSYIETGKKIGEAETACNARQLAKMVLKLTKNRKNRVKQDKIRI